MVKLILPLLSIRDSGKIRNSKTPNARIQRAREAATNMHASQMKATRFALPCNELLDVAVNVFCVSG